MSVDWSYYDKFDRITDMYLPSQGEGDTMATQIVTAVTKLVYKWYNDGDVFDNNYILEGWANDLSSYANWLYNNLSFVRPTLDQIKDCWNDGDYEDLLKELADTLFDDEDLERWNMKPKVGSIYTADGPYSFDEYRGEDDEDDWDSEYEEEEMWDDDEEDEYED